MEYCSCSINMYLTPSALSCFKIKRYVNLLSYVMLTRTFRKIETMYCYVFMVHSSLYGSIHFLSNVEECFSHYYMHSNPCTMLYIEWQRIDLALK